MRKSSEYTDDSQRTQEPNSEKFLKFLLKSWIIVTISAVSALSAARLLAAPEATELNIPLLRPDSAPLPNTADFKFPIESYAGLEKANAERVAKFEAETKAMLTQRSGLAKSSQDIHEAVSVSHHRHGE